MDNPDRSDPHRGWFSRHIALALASTLGIALGALLLRSWGHWKFSSRYSDREKVRADIAAIHQALDSFAMTHAGAYPVSIRELVVPDQNGLRYLASEDVLFDPWGCEYVYALGQPPNVMSLGRDRSLGGTGDDADIDYLTIANGR